MRDGAPRRRQRRSQRRTSSPLGRSMGITGLLASCSPYSKLWAGAPGPSLNGSEGLVRASPKAKVGFRSVFPALSLFNRPTTTVPSPSQPAPSSGSPIAQLTPTSRSSQARSVCSLHCPPLSPLLDQWPLQPPTTPPRTLVLHQSIPLPHLFFWPERPS